MRKCVIVLDSFKGSMNLIEISQIASKSIKRFFPQCNVIEIPVADGGE